MASELPCDSDGVCMVCRTNPCEEEILTCITCDTEWHVTCLAWPPQTLAHALEWNCPDCTILTFSGSDTSSSSSSGGGGSGEDSQLITAILRIESDGSLTEQQKAKRRQELLCRPHHEAEEGKEEENDQKYLWDILDDNVQCSFCIDLPVKPVTTPCGHSSCLECFQKWIGQGDYICAKCRSSIPLNMAIQPRINTSLVSVIREAKMSKSVSAQGLHKDLDVHNKHKPDEAYTTQRAKNSGMANAASGGICVTTPPDHFGPILAQNDPLRRQGVKVGECWELRVECRQWGIHYPRNSGIAGQSGYGAQSVVLSRGYEDDHEDHGEWFLYTGSGGSILSGSKRTSKTQSFNQTFNDYNEALRKSCINGYPVRVVRSYKEKISSYAPEKGLRYDGIYRIEKCWRKVGTKGHKVCRYLFVRCDNEPAPWTSDEHGDRPRPLPAITEIQNASDLFERTQSPSWDYDEVDACWRWKKPAPPSRKRASTGNHEVSEHRQNARRERKRKAEYMSKKEKLLKEFGCFICKRVMTLPVTTPCAHNFCKSCLEGKFAGQAFTKERSRGGRTLRSQKNVMKCPACPHDICQFLQNLQVNREVMDIIERLKERPEDENTVED